MIWIRCGEGVPWIRRVGNDLGTVSVSYKCGPPGRRYTRGIVPRLQWGHGCGLSLRNGGLHSVELLPPALERSLHLHSAGWPWPALSHQLQFSIPASTVKIRNTTPSCCIYGSIWQCNKSAPTFLFSGWGLVCGIRTHRYLESFF